MSALKDSKVVVRDRSDNRAIWVRPILRRLTANKAEGNPGMKNDGHEDRS
jgi:hypothetical protein